MRQAILVAIGLLLFLPPLYAQELTEVQKPTTAESQSATAPARQTASKLPHPGHPLDPRDVDILTGKADREANQRQTTVYIGVDGYGYGRLARHRQRLALQTPFFRLPLRGLPLRHPKRIFRPFFPLLPFFPGR